MEFKLNLRYLVTAVLALLISATTFAQTIQLTPEQRRMLESLPPAQRAQAEAAMRQFGDQQSENELRPVSEVTSEEGLVSGLEEDPDEMDEEEEFRAEAGSRLVIELMPKLAWDSRAMQDIDDDPLLSSLLGTHHVVLDDAGALTLRGLESIPLLGLTEDDIAKRLSAERHLAKFDIAVRILDMSPIGAAALEPFGYEIFETEDASFDSIDHGPRARGLRDWTRRLDTGAIFR